MPLLGDNVDSKTRLKLIHESVDRFNKTSAEQMGKQKVTPAALLFQEVQSQFVHTLVDARVKHDMALSDIEEAICALCANMIGLLIRSAISPDGGPIALMIGKRMSEKMDDYLYDSIASNFHNTGEEPTDDDKIH
jgi:hypothetical protein